jgi:hypothetical protein
MSSFNGNASLVQASPFTITKVRSQNLSFRLRPTLVYHNRYSEIAPLGTDIKPSNAKLGSNLLFVAFQDRCIEDKLLSKKHTQ